VACKIKALSLVIKKVGANLGLYSKQTEFIEWMTLAK
jgi:hypothetical protein